MKDSRFYVCGSCGFRLTDGSPLCVECSLRFAKKSIKISKSLELEEILNKYIQKEARKRKDEEDSPTPLNKKKPKPPNDDNE